MASVYYDLVIVATSPDTEIWLGDDDGHLVQKEIGILETSLLPGDYNVEFGLGSQPYPIHLTAASLRPNGPVEGNRIYNDRVHLLAEDHGGGRPALVRAGLRGRLLNVQPA